jgi:hypothetical protein
MALASAWAVALHGVDGVLVEIEAHIGPGLPGLQMVGLPDAACLRPGTGSVLRCSTRGGDGRRAG